MKISVLALLLSTTLFACSSGKLEKTLTSAAIGNQDDFNDIPKSKDKIFTIEDVVSENPDSAGAFVVKYKDTVLNIQDGSKPLVTKFQEARFINSQKTAILVQTGDGAGKISPFYIINLKDGLTQAVALTKPSNGKKDQTFIKGLEEITRTSLLINNDFVVSTVRGKVYQIKRKNNSEIIQGNFLVYSTDRTTLVFSSENSLYQVNYLTGETSDLPVSAKVLQSPSLPSDVQRNYSWVKNARGTYFLKENPDEDRIVDISEFK